MKNNSSQGILFNIQQSSRGYFQYDAAIQILKDIDLIYFDIKVADPRIHKDYTFKSNMRIL